MGASKKVNIAFLNNNEANTVCIINWWRICMIGVTGVYFSSFGLLSRKF